MIKQYQVVDQTNSGNIILKKLLNGDTLHQFFFDIDLSNFTKIEEGQFKYCNIKNVILHENIFLNSNCFAYNYAIEELYLPVVNFYDNGAAFFKSCINLKKVEIASGNTAIPWSCFEYCTNLKEVIIPNTITKINYSAFIGCKSLTEIIFQGTIEQWNAIEKYNYWNDYVPATYVQCTDGQVTLQEV